MQQSLPTSQRWILLFSKTPFGAILEKGYALSLACMDQRQLNLSPEQEIALLSHYIQLRDVERKLFAEREHLREALLVSLHLLSAIYKALHRIADVVQ